jgi:nicotinamide phosphoribosyltransferase
MGGALLQKVNRDTQKFAFKCSSVTVNGQDRDVFKDPITDKGKQSKKGSLALVKRLGKFQTVPAPAIDDLLEVVYENGVLKRDQTLSEIRVLTGL